MTAQQIREEALSRAENGQSFSNYPAIFAGFMAKGIAESEILPRSNVFTFKAWQAKGRQVRKGEHGVRVTTYREITRRERDEQSGAEKVVPGRIPWHTTVFHVSQTDERTR